MAAIITPNNRAVQNNVAPAPATKSDGSNYVWRMSFNGNSLFADADSLAELIAVLFGDDYLDLTTETERFAARISYAERMQIAARANLAATVSPEKASRIEDWEWDLLTYEDTGAGADPYGWGDGEGTVGVLNPGKIDFWSLDIPLVLLTTSYAPFTEIPRPLSTEGDFKYVKNLVWLRPEKEYDFLQSLKHIGYITLGQPQAALRLDSKGATKS